MTPYSNQKMKKYKFLLWNRDETFIYENFKSIFVLESIWNKVGRLFGDLFNFGFNLELRFFKADSKTMLGFDTLFKSENEKSFCVENFKYGNFKTIFVPDGVMRGRSFIQFAYLTLN